jgi:hypothetical protein
LQVITNPSPSLVSSTYGVTSYSLMWNAQVRLPAAHVAAGAHATQRRSQYTTSLATLDGEFIDGLANVSSQLNFRQSHFSAARYPLTFGTRSLRPALLQGLTNLEFSAQVAADLRTMQKILVGNGALKAVTPFVAPYDFLVRLSSFLFIQAQVNVLCCITM